MDERSLLNALAHAFLSGKVTEADIRERAAYVLGREWPWLRPIIRRYVRAVTGRANPRRTEVVGFLAQSRFFHFAMQKFRGDLTVRSWIASPQARAIVDRWNLPKIPDIATLCRWLAIDFEHLEWFADRRRLNYGSGNPKFQNYTYRVLAKPGGSIRLIESPKKTLKELQRRILYDLLRKVPPHSAVHGFVRERSIKTFVAPHTGKHVILRMDLENFFPNIRSARAQSVFRTFGYPDAVAAYLAGLCTNRAPRDLWNAGLADHYELSSIYSASHLPQGAPTSPALANLCAYRLDCRLAALAKRVGATYTRYADDLAFSGNADFSRRAERFSIHAAAIAIEEGFPVNHHKTRIMRQGVRQHLAGLTANRHTNLHRAAFDRLKAILTNCVHHGPASQNRDCRPDFRAHLAGRIGFVEMVNPQKAARLQAIFQQIHWS